MSWAAKQIKINIYTIDHDKADTLKLIDCISELYTESTANQDVDQTQMSQEEATTVTSPPVTPPAPVVDVADNVAGTNQWIGNFLLF